MGKTKNKVDERALKFLLSAQEWDPERIKQDYLFDSELKKLQEELYKLQKWVIENNERVTILFEGRDASGRGGTIRRIVRYMNPRYYRVLALPIPTEIEKGQWYFQRYITRLPNPGEIVFFDRSWYNRAMVEPIMGFCTPRQYDQFMSQVPEFEEMIVNDGIHLVKFWYALSQTEQAGRISEMKKNPLKKWKVSPIDEASIKLYQEYSKHRDKMFRATHKDYSPWTIVDAEEKNKARLDVIRYLLMRIPYDDKDESLLLDKPVRVRHYQP